MLTAAVNQDFNRTDRAKGWYDSAWLTKYIDAKEIVARVAPSRLEEFQRRFDSLRAAPELTQRFLPGFLNELKLTEIRDAIRKIPRASIVASELEEFGRFLVRRWPPFVELQAGLVGKVSELAGEPVEPSYNFLSLYTGLGVCKPHLDAPSAKWTLDICIEQSDPWPISFSQTVPWPETRSELNSIDIDAVASSQSLNFTQEVLMPGDAVLFSGTNQWHFRDALPRKSGRRYCDLLFLHYVPCGTAELIQPKSWARLFDIPELEELKGIDDTF